MIWRTDNRQAWIDFADGLLYSLSGCFQQPGSRTTRVQVQRERMWEPYHKLRSSQSYKDYWAKFLHNSINHDACPIFYQFVGDAIMEMLIKQRFPLKTVQEDLKVALDYEEKTLLGIQPVMLLMLCSKRFHVQHILSRMNLHFA